MRQFPGRSVICATLALTGLMAVANERPATLPSQAAIVSSLDSAIQGRFRQVTPGKFGKHALIGIDDLPAGGLIDPLDAENAAERADMRLAVNSGHGMVVGMLHCRYKPDRDIALDGKSDDTFKPYAETLVSLGDSPAHASRTFDWATTHIDAASRGAFRTVMAGNPVSGSYHGYYVAIRPVTAHYPLCLTCHHGLHRGDTIAGIIYLVAKHRSAKPSLYVRRIGGG